MSMDNRLGSYMNEPECLLGSKLENARNTDFFTWFCLEQTDSMGVAGPRTTHIFKPSGEKFHELVTVRVSINAEGHIDRLELILARSFINDRREGIFARDIAKSFLRSATPRPDGSYIADLANEIEFRLQDSQSAIPIIRHSSIVIPPLPERPSAGYLTFLGRESLYQKVCHESVIRLENLMLEGVNSLVMSIKRRG